MDEKQLVKFNTFIEESKDGAIRRLVHGLNLSEDDAKDIYQESVIALYDHIHGGIDCSLDKYFNGICYRQALKFIRKHKRIVNCDMGNPLFDDSKRKGISTHKLTEIMRTIPHERIFPQMAMPPDETTNLTQMKERVSKALDGMANRCKQLLTKYYLEGYTWSELAMEFNLKNADTAKAAANRCRRQFGEKYKELKAFLRNP